MINIKVVHLKYYTTSLVAYNNKAIINLLAKLDAMLVEYVDNSG